MRRMCGLSSQTRNRSLLKSMRNMAGPWGSTAKAALPDVTHIAVRVNEGLRGRRPLFGSVPELLAQNAFFQAVTGVEQHPHRDGLVGGHLAPADIARLVVVGHRRDRALVALEHLDDHIGGVGQ